MYTCLSVLFLLLNPWEHKYGPVPFLPEPQTVKYIHFDIFNTQGLLDQLKQQPGVLQDSSFFEETKSWTYHWNLGAFQNWAAKPILSHTGWKYFQCLLLHFLGCECKEIHYSKISRKLQLSMLKCPCISFFSDLIQRLLWGISVNKKLLGNQTFQDSLVRRVHQILSVQTE